MCVYLYYCMENETGYLDNVFKLYGMNGNQYDQKGKSPNNAKRLRVGSQKIGTVTLLHKLPLKSHYWPPLKFPIKNGPINGQF